MGAESRSKESREAVPVLVQRIDTGAGPSGEKRVRFGSSFAGEWRRESRMSV